MNLGGVRESNHAILLTLKSPSILAFLFLSPGDVPWPLDLHTINSMWTFLLAIYHMRDASFTGTRESSLPCAIESSTVIFSALFSGEIHSRNGARTVRVRLVAVLVPPLRLVAPPVRRVPEEGWLMGDAKVGQSARELGRQVYE